MHKIDLKNNLTIHRNFFTKLYEGNNTKKKSFVFIDVTILS